MSNHKLNVTQAELNAQCTFCWSAAIHTMNTIQGIWVNCCADCLTLIEKRGRELERQRIDDMVNDLICNLQLPKLLESHRLNQAYQLGQKESLLTVIEKIREKK